MVIAVTQSCPPISKDFGKIATLQRLKTYAQKRDSKKNLSRSFNFSIRFVFNLFVCLFFFFHFSLYIITPLFLRYDSQCVDHQIIVNSFSIIFALALSCHHLYLSTHKHNFVDTRYFLCTRALFSRVLF